MHESILVGHHSALRPFNVTGPEAFFLLTLFEIDILHLFRCLSTSKRDGAGNLVVTSVKRTFKGFKMISIIPYTFALLIITSFHWGLSCLILFTLALVRNRDSHSRQVLLIWHNETHFDFGRRIDKSFQLIIVTGIFGRANYKVNSRPYAPFIHIYNSYA